MCHFQEIMWDFSRICGALAYCGSHFGMKKLIAILEEVQIGGRHIHTNPSFQPSIPNGLSPTFSYFFTTAKSNQTTASEQYSYQHANICFVQDSNSWKNFKLHFLSTISYNWLILKKWTLVRVVK